MTSLLPAKALAERLPSFVKRHRDDLRASAAAADVHVELGADRRVRSRQIRHPNRLLEIRRLGAAGDDAGFFAPDVDLVAVPGDAAVEHFEADDLSRDPFGLLFPQHLGADEVVFLPADDPAEV